MRPLAIELFAGLHGWGAGLAAAGFRVVGFDIADMPRLLNHPVPEQCSLVLQDVLTLHGSQFRDAHLIVASPPCQEFSYMAMPFSRGKRIAAALRGQGEFPEGYTGSRTLPQLTALFDACFRIQREASEAAGRYIPLVVENVRGAEPWVGRAKWHFGSYYLWGDVPALMPHACRLNQPKHPGVNFHANEHGGVSPAFNGLKIPGMNFHDHAKTGKPGRSFQSACVGPGVVAGTAQSEGIMVRELCGGKGSAARGQQPLHRQQLSRPPRRIRDHRQDTAGTGRAHRASLFFPRRGAHRMTEQWTPPKCAACSDSGMRTTYLLVTYEGGDRYSFKKIEQVSREKYEFLRRELGEMEARGEKPRQKVGTGAVRCECQKGAA